MELTARGRGTNYERFDIPIARDGGIAGLLAEAAHPNRRFDVVICESTSRVARRMFHENLGYATIVDRLNAGPDRYPPPVLAGGRA